MGSELNVPKEKFKDFFGVDWDETLKAGKIFNAKDACEKLEVDSSKLDEMWSKAKKEKRLIKFGGGFYCGELPAGDDKIYVFNGFFMSMRSKFVSEGASIYYYVISWDPKKCSWKDFRGKVLGPTDPEPAPSDLLRGAILKDWKALGLKSSPNVGDNGVHASASPFEAYAERANWLGFRPDRDTFGKLLLKAGISRGLIKDWSNDPQVTYGIVPITASLFDSLEDEDTDYCLALCQMIASFSHGEKDSKTVALEKEVTKLKEQLALYESVGRAVALIQEFKPPLVPKEPKAKPKAKADPKDSKGSEVKVSSGKPKSRRGKKAVSDE